MGFVEGRQALELIVTQMFWLVGMLLLGRLVFAAGARKLVVQGG